MVQVQHYAMLIAQFLGFITIGATMLVRFMPKYKADVDSVSETIWRYINMLPTVGVNPRTKQLESAYREALK